MPTYSVGSADPIGLNESHLHYIRDYYNRLNSDKLCRVDSSIQSTHWLSFARIRFPNQRFLRENIEFAAYPIAVASIWRR